MNQKVLHQSITLKWPQPGDINNPQALVLGSFNPFNNLDAAVDYYYGRETNHFWKTIAIITNKEENHFFHKTEGLQRKLAVMKDKFCCLDVINSIEISSDGDLALSYINNKIFSNFLDQSIWVSKTEYEEKGKVQKKGKVQLVRTYNSSICDILLNSTSIKKVINTMGRNRISLNSISPVEARLKANGFNGFMKNIIEICQSKNIHFEYESYSPSDYAVKNGYTKKEDLQAWLKKNLEI